MAQVQALLEDLRPGRYQPFLALASAASSNQVLLDGASPEPGELGFCVVREQTAGRGRRGRRWLSHSEYSLTFSLSRRAFRGEVPDTRLPLVAAVAAERALRALGAVGVGIKWPNDLVDRVSGAKFGGFLIEGCAATASQEGFWVLGLGLNVRGAETFLLDRLVTDLVSLMPDSVPVESLLAALLLELGDAWEQFALEGFNPFAQEYARVDWLRGREVMVVATGERGVADGIDPDSGCLRLILADGCSMCVMDEVICSLPGSSR